MMSVYIAVTDGHGKVPLILRLVDVDEQQPPVFEAKNEVVFDDPRVVYEVDFCAINPVFPTAGEYRLQLLAGTDPIMERRILLARIGDQEHGSENQPQNP
jgi:hypothetical protein